MKFNIPVSHEISQPNNSSSPGVPGDTGRNSDSPYPFGVPGELGHKYPGIDEAFGGFYTSDCAYGCGCWMGRFSSGGPDGVDPHGACPNAHKFAE